MCLLWNILWDSIYVLQNNCVCDGNTFRTKMRARSGNPSNCAEDARQLFLVSTTTITAIINNLCYRQRVND